MKSRSLKKRNLVGNCSNSISDVDDDDDEDKNDDEDDDGKCLHRVWCISVNSI